MFNKFYLNYKKYKKYKNYSLLLFLWHSLASRRLASQQDRDDDWVTAGPSGLAAAREQAVVQTDRSVQKRAWLWLSGVKGGQREPK